MGRCAVTVLACACAISLGGSAKSEEAVPQAVPSPSQASPPPTPTPALVSKAKVFSISPEESDQIFMCEAGRVQSVLATAIAEHRPVSITLLDPSKAPIPEGVWTSAYGFRLTHKQNVIISVMMICGE
jgi:hypothetical protein